jgi:hypothetical protein
MPAGAELEWGGRAKKICLKHFKQRENKGIPLKVHSNKKVCEIIAVHYSLDLN